MKESEMTKIKKYQDLAIEIIRKWKTKVRVIPIVICVLGVKHLPMEWLALLAVQGKTVDRQHSTDCSVGISTHPEEIFGHSSLVVVDRWQNQTAAFSRNLANKNNYNSNSNKIIQRVETLNRLLC